MCQAQGVNYTRHYGSHGPWTHKCCSAHLYTELEIGLFHSEITWVQRYRVKCIAGKRKKTKHIKIILWKLPLLETKQGLCAAKEGGEREEWRDFWCSCPFYVISYVSLSLQRYKPETHCLSAALWGVGGRVPSDEFPGYNEQSHRPQKHRATREWSYKRLSSLRAPNPVSKQKAREDGRARDPFTTSTTPPLTGTESMGTRRWDRK